MEPISPMQIMFDTSRRYPEEVYEAFEPIKELYDMLLLMTHGLLADGPVTLTEVSAVLEAHHMVNCFVDKLKELNFVGLIEDISDKHLYVVLSAFLAMKIRDKDIYESTKDECLQRCVQLLDYLVDDNRLSKKDTLEALSKLKAEVTKRIVAVRKRHNKPFKFHARLENYADRADKKENPKDFLLRVYGIYFVGGLRPVHVRYRDPGLYNNLHVWCSRNKVEIASLFDKELDLAARRATDKQKIIKKAKAVQL